LIWVNDKGPAHFRDITPKDFYFIQIQRNEDPEDEHLAVKILSRLVLDEEALDLFTLDETQKLFDWALENLLAEKIMSLEHWLTTAYHLCKQRWDQSVDWLESQPVPKILLMIDIVNAHAKAQEAEMKKSARKR
jgi:hypothetical protein